MSGGPTAVRRGDVVVLDWPFSDGGGSKVRPAVVVQADALNGRLTNVILAALTTNLRRSARPTQLRIHANTVDGRACGLLYDSAVTCENLLTVTQTRVLRRIGRLPPPRLKELDACLRAALGL